MRDAYDAWLFDLDGTLVDTSWSYKRAVFDDVGAELGREFDDDQVERLWHGLCSSRDALLRGWGCDPEAFWTVFDRVDDPVARAEATYLYDDGRAITDIDRPRAVVTHCPEPITDRVLDRLDIADWFDAVVCCSDELGWKPDPAPVETALADLDAPAERAVLVGDGEGDVGAAWNAGLDAVHVERHGPERRGQCVLGDHRIRSVDALTGRSTSADA